MARATFVKAARKDYPDHGIKKGESYWHWKFMQGGRGGAKRYSKTKPKPSQLTQSEFWGNVLGLQESNEATPHLDDIESQIEEIKSELEGWRDEQEERRSNLPDSLQDGSSGELLQGRYDALEECVNTLDSVDFSYDQSEKEETETDEEYETRVEDEKQYRAEEIWSEVTDALGSISCD